MFDSCQRQCSAYSAITIVIMLDSSTIHVRRWPFRNCSNRDRVSQLDQLLIQYKMQGHGIRKPRLFIRFGVWDVKLQSPPPYVS